MDPHYLEPTPLSDLCKRGAYPKEERGPGSRGPWRVLQLKFPPPPLQTIQDPRQAQPHCAGPAPCCFEASAEKLAEGGDPTGRMKVASFKDVRPQVGESTRKVVDPTCLRPSCLSGGL